MHPALTITTSAGSYPVIIEAGALTRLPTLLEEHGLHGTLWLICDAAIAERYGHPLATVLQQHGRTIHHYQVASGETSKDLAVAADLYTWMLEHGVERRDTVLALGGGVIGDLAGFVAATILRGISIVQLPTTLQAMVDAAIGGKTGVNHARGKNLIGAFHQPRLVLGDTTTLTSLPTREFQSGWAEAIKHGVIRDAGLFEQLEQFANQHTRLPQQTLAALIQRAVQVKVEIVNIDERETAERMLLNYGHTLGHAIETAAGYGTLLHGEAVAIGMDLEAQLAHQLGMIDASLVERQRQLLHAYGLPTSIPTDLQPEIILALTLRDKKVRAGKIRWALPTSIGNAVIRDDLPEQLVRTILS